eukprot:3125079-Amphidinium_carterae.1
MTAFIGDSFLSLSADFVCVSAAEARVRGGSSGGSLAEGYTDLEQLLRLAEELPKCSQLRACKIEIIRDAETLRRLLQGLRGAVGGGALQLLRFEGCKKIGSDEAVMNELCETLRAHQNSLAGLTLRYCGITSNGAKQLKEALKQCRQLRTTTQHRPMSPNFFPSSVVVL